MIANSHEVKTMTDKQKRQIEQAIRILSDTQKFITVGDTERTRYVIDLAKMQLDEVLEDSGCIIWREVNQLSRSR